MCGGMCGNRHVGGGFARHWVLHPPQGPGVPDVFAALRTSVNERFLLNNDALGCTVYKDEIYEGNYLSLQSSFLGINYSCRKYNCCCTGKGKDLMEILLILAKKTLYNINFTFFGEKGTDAHVIFTRAGLCDKSAVRKSCLMASQKEYPSFTQTT